MALPLLPSTLSVKRVNSSVFSGGSTANVNIQGTEPSIRQQLLEQSKQFIQTQNQNQAVVNNIQQQFQSLQNQINVLAKGITNIANLIQQDTISEQQLLKQEQQQENAFSLRKIRIGRESQIEQRIEAALSVPVQKASSALEGIFGRVGSALQIMFFGFLGVQSLNAIRAWQEGDYKRLGEIKNLIAENILYAIGAIAAVKLGLPLIGFAVRRLIGKIGGFLFSGIRSIFTSIVGKIGQFLSGIGSAVTKPFRASPSAPSSPSGSPAKPPTAPVPKANPIQRAMGAAGRLARRFGGPLIQGTVGTAIDIAMGEDPGRALAGAAGGVVAAAPAAAVGSLLGPLGSFGGGLAGYSLGSDFTKGLYDKFFGKPAGSDSAGSVTPTSFSSPPKETTQSPETSSTKNMMESMSMPQNTFSIPTTSPSQQSTENITPKSSMLPSSNDLTVNFDTDKVKKEGEYWKSEEQYWKTIADGLEAGMSYEQLGLDQNEIDYLEGKTEEPPFLMNTEKMKNIEKIGDSIPKMKQGEVQNKPISIPQIKPPEEPTPNVIVTSPQTQQSSSGQSPPAGTDVPLIPSSNPDNFYVLYSQLNYNVIM
jgi:hypothetical protein